ncbi:MAG: leucyl aminopeptidase, partial [Cellulomonadaceae bacterium]|nr:leucyl aminopeptidase [Cellulomonadaceae bacterium]
RELAGTTTVAVALPNANEDDVNAIAEGALLGAYAYNAYRTKDAKAAVQKLEVLSAGARSERAKVAIKRAEVVAEAVHGARDLVNTPPNVLYPETFVEAARSAVKDSGAKNIAITVLDEKALISGGFGGIAGVGQGSDRPPRLVKLAYTPAGATQHVGLVGKGITYDSGGISLKPGSSLHTMTLDMAGAAAVLQTIVAAARLAVPVAVTGYLCLAENMPGGHAMRPDDVLTMRSGTTVEVTNTDAEGRLVMADGIAEAVNDGVDIVLDIATLTGAQMIALGSRVSAVMGDDDIRSGVVDAAKACGEEFWPMPLTPDTKAGLKSKIADLLNTPSTRYGGMLAAGWFLEAFRGETPWAHLDIAGPAYNEGAAFGYTPQLATGVGVRTLLTYLESLA